MRDGAKYRENLAGNLFQSFRDLRLGQRFTFINLLRVRGSIFVFAQKMYPFETAFFSAPEIRICI
jgi:hypothetical protein